MRHAWILVSLILGVSFLGTGCFTTMLWKDDAEHYKEHHYEDTIQSFLITEDGKQIIFVSDRYHYIFQSDPTLHFLLTHREDVSTLYHFYGASARYTITERPQKGYNAIASFDVDVNTSTIPNLPMGTHLTRTQKYYNITLYDGNRYLADPKINAHLTPMSHPITLSILQRDRDGWANAGENAKRLLLTPLTLAADGVSIVLAAGIGVVVLPFAIIDSVSH